MVMGEIRIWLTAKDNPHLNEQEIAAQNAKWDLTINAETLAKAAQEMERDELDAIRHHENWWNDNAAQLKP
jgi:hypothetical protein